ncbi:MAG: DNA repair protein RecN [Verrucomicrobiota bacterium]
MLQLLRIKNLAVIEDLTWELGQGFNILTGETGAGKSILIDALSLLLGAKADKGLVRDGADACSVEAGLSHVTHVHDLLQEHGIEPSEDGQLVLKRIFSKTAPNRQFINGSPTTLQVLKKLGDYLVDMHGPHDHQSLLSTDQQMKALDAYAGLEAPLAHYKREFQQWLAAGQELDELTSLDGTDWRQQLEFLEYQINEIEAAHLDEDDEEKLEHDYKLAINTQKIAELGGSVQRMIGESEPDVLTLLGQVQRQLHEWQKLDDSVSNLVDINESAVAQLRDLQNEVDNLVSKSELDGRRLVELENRMNTVQTLKKKYGSTVPAILSNLQRMKEKRETFVNREENINELQQTVGVMEEKLKALAQALSQKRLAALQGLGKSITKELQELGFKKAVFDGELKTADKLKMTGQDSIEFLFAPNPGEASRPLRVIASSGEMARVMLAVKTVLAKQDEVPILIFDEVDANVGGETAVAVAKKLRGLAESHQVLCITHLPQVAAAGQNHVRVIKDVENERTSTRLEMLQDEIRIEEISRMLGGKNESALSLAKSLLDEYKA